LKRCCVLQDHYDDECDKTVFYNTTQLSDLHDQDQDRFFCIRPVLSLRPTVSYHIAAYNYESAPTWYSFDRDSSSTRFLAIAQRRGFGYMTSRWCRYIFNTVAVLTSCARGDTICPRPSPPPWAPKGLARRRADAT